VADACVRQGDGCISEVTVPVGTQLTLSGVGSSGSDGPERDDVPAHRVGTTKHWYWDFQTQNDHPAPIPNYQEGTRYPRCDDGDCDRDEVDDRDDDRDAEGRTVTYMCEEAGTFRIRLMVWDEHHDQWRRHVEDRSHNRGRHWLHFNVDDDWVTVTCEESETPPPTEVPPPTGTPTPTPTGTPTPTATPSPTPTPKRVLTGVSSFFTAETTDTGHVVNAGITALNAELDGVIYDAEIFTACTAQAGRPATTGQRTAEFNELSVVGDSRAGDVCGFGGRHGRTTGDAAAKTLRPGEQAVNLPASTLTMFIISRSRGEATRIEGLGGNRLCSELPCPYSLPNCLNRRPIVSYLPPNVEQNDPYQRIIKREEVASVCRCTFSTFCLLHFSPGRKKP